MRMSRRSIVISHPDGMKIISMPATVKHSHEIAVCPPGFMPGHERFLSQAPNGRVVFDLKGHNEHMVAHIEKHQEVSSWNGQGPIERFKNKLKGKS
jgi:hypothetical protein